MSDEPPSTRCEFSGCKRTTYKFRRDYGHSLCDYHYNKHETLRKKMLKAKNDFVPMKTQEAIKIVYDVRDYLVKEHDSEEKMLRLIYMEIKKGYKYNHKFYQALQTCLISQEPIIKTKSGRYIFHVQGATSRICETKGVPLITKMHQSPRLYVFFTIEKGE